MIETLSNNPIFLLFVVASLGYLVGSRKVGGSSLGVAAILFTGLMFGAYDPSLKLPEEIVVLGLAIYVYSIGLSSGPAFFKSYQKNGVRDFIFLVCALILSGVIAFLIFWVSGYSPALVTGIYTGSTTNTPALASVIDYINNQMDGQQALEEANQAVIGYSLSYPMGVMGSIIGIVLMEKLLKIDYEKERKENRKEYPTETRLSSATVLVDNPKCIGKSLRELNLRYNWDISFGRIIKNKETSLARWDTILNEGDILMILGYEEDIELAIGDIGQKTSSHLAYDRTQFDVMRIFVSNPDIAGRTIASLELDKKYNAIITRLRRGDTDRLVDGNTILEIGDRVRFVAKREDLRSISNYFGDSYTASSKVNLFSFGLWIGLGLLLGTINISLGDNFNFSLGFAGGPLIIGMLLGALRRTGPIVWTLPYSATVTLQQIGLIFFLAGVGVNSGEAFISSFNLSSLWIILCSSIVSITTACIVVFMGYKMLKIPFSILMGIVSNQPAIIDFATSRSGNKIPEYGFTMMFPIALTMKIIIAQILYIILINL